MRERGLKRKVYYDQHKDGTSLPMRERGLKPRKADLQKAVAESLPMRERGLKHNIIPDGGYVQGVAPHAGAWIETYLYELAA